MLTNVRRTPTIVILMQSVQTEKDLTTALAIMGTQEMVSTAQVRIHIEIHLYEPCLTLIYKRESFLMTLILTYIVFFTIILTDIDECVDNLHNCDDNAYCNNTVASYNCTCNIGYHGSGFNCTGKILFTIDHY